MNLRAAAAAFREVAKHCEESLALDCVKAAADVALVQLQIVTPVLTGQLRDSEHIDAVFGGGLHATAVLAPHKIYAHFRNEGGEINSKGPWSLHNAGTGQYFGRHVTQAGSHYMERGESAGRGPAREAIARVAAFYLTL
jgi:hypothetical protein